MDPVVAIHPFLFGQSLIKTFLRLLKGLLFHKTQTLTSTGTTSQEREHFSHQQKHRFGRYAGILHLVPLWFLHFFGLPLCGEDETGAQSRHRAFSDRLLRVPYCVKDVVEEGLHLLKEESGGAHSQLPQDQHLEEEW